MSLAQAQEHAAAASAAILRDDYATAQRLALAGFSILSAIPTVGHGERSVDTSALFRNYTVLFKQIENGRKGAAGIRFTSTTRAPLTR